MPISAYIHKIAAPSLPEGMFKWQGPKSYTVVTAGNPPSGGDSLPAILLGIDEILMLIGEGSYSGNFQVVPIRVSGTKWTLQWRALRSATIGGQSQTTGTEAAASTDLSGEYVTLRVLSRTA